MAILISDEIIRQTSMQEDDLRVELAIMLYQAELLSFGKAREFSGLDVLRFLAMLRDRKIEMPYRETDFEEDLAQSKKIRLAA